MKAIKIFGLLLFAAFAFNSCSDDDEEEAMDVTDTYWATSKVVTSNNVNSITQEFINDDLETFFYNQTIHFDAEGVFSIYDPYYEAQLEGTWVQSGSKIVVTITNGDEVTIRNYTISGSTLSQKETTEEGDIIMTKTFTFTEVIAS